MPYVLAIVLGITAGLFVGGKISNILDFRIKRAWLIILAFLILAISQSMSARGFKIASDNALIIHAIVFCMLLAGFYFNRRYRGMLAIGSGCALNLIVIMLNGGRMPVSLEVLETAGLVEAAEMVKSGLDLRHCVLDAGARLPFLADIICLPPFWGFMMRVASIGDLIVVAGLLIVAFEIVKGGFKSERLVRKDIRVIQRQGD